MEWIQTLPEGSAKRNALQSVSWQLAQNDPKSAVDFISNMPASRERDNFIGQVASQWSQSDLNGALAWVQQLPEGRARQDALNNLAPQWAQLNPQGAFDFAQNLQAGSGESEILNFLHTTNQSEIRLGRLAQTQGSSENIREYGRMLVRDHTANDAKVQEVARAASIPLSDASDRDSAATRRSSGRRSPPTASLSPSSGWRAPTCSFLPVPSCG